MHSKYNKIKNCIQRLPKTRLVLITAPPVWEPKLEEMNISKGKLPTLDRTNDRYYSTSTVMPRQSYFPYVLLLLVGL